MHANTAMQPGQEQDNGLEYPEIWSVPPERQYDIGVGILHVKPGMRQTRSHNVRCEQEGNCQAHE